MNISELVQSTAWKAFMAKLYGIGASVVIVGALFKIMHWPGAGLMLIVGLGTEATIFLFSAFEPLHEELDWTLVYPELAGMTDPDDMDEIREEEINARGVEALEKFDEIVKDSNISAETFTKLGTGMTQLNTTVENLSDISEATIASRQYIDNVKNAAVNAESLSSVYSETSETLQNSIGSMAASYQNTAGVVESSSQAISEQISQSGEKLLSTYEKMTSMIDNYSGNISENGKSYGDQLTSINHKLTMLNELYEQQHKVTEEKLQQTKQLFEGFNQMNTNLVNSVEQTKKYRDELETLSNNLSSLNNIYGNMLSAMNVKG